MAIHPLFEHDYLINDYESDEARNETFIQEVLSYIGCLFPTIFLW